MVTVPVASLPMYDWPEVAWATDALWRAIAERLNAAGLAAPETLERSRPMEDVWRDPGLVLSQTCGWPYATRLKDAVALVATPVYDAEGCAGPHYSSALVARRASAPKNLADCVGLRFALNSRESLSGYIALVAEMRKAGLDPDAAKWIETGGHRASLRAVAEGRADVASVDCICMALAREHEADMVARLTTFARTRPRPALPLITARGHSAAEIMLMRAAVAEALADREAVLPREALHLRAVEALEEADYAAASLEA